MIKLVGCFMKGRIKKQGGALSAGVATWKRMEARRCIVCRCGDMEEDGSKAVRCLQVWRHDEGGSKAVHCLQVWRHGRGWKQGGALSAGVAT